MLLAFDTSMAACSAAVYDMAGARVVAGRFTPMERGHADALAPMISEVMAEAGIAFSALERIGVTKGPGTFTGVRTSIAMARGLALALGRKVAAIDTLSAIAANAPADRTPLVIAADARREEVYFSMPGTTASPLVLPIEEAARRLPLRQSFILGSGSEALIAAAPQGRLVRLAAGDMPDARNFAALCANRPVSENPPEPLYLRPPDAKPQREGANFAAETTIREATLAEAGILSTMHTECFDNAWSAGEFSALMSLPGTWACLALEGDEPVGFVLARQAAGEAEILTIGTRPFARRRGIARNLMSHVVHRLRETGLDQLFIEVAADNGAARALYEGEKFTITGRRASYYAKPGGARADAVVMTRALGQ